MNILGDDCDRVDAVIAAQAVYDAPAKISRGDDPHPGEPRSCTVVVHFVKA
jgi:hypothetical protein